MDKVIAGVFADPQHGPGVTVRIGDSHVSVYLFGETGIATTPEGQYGIEVVGPWPKFREQAKQLLEKGNG